MFITHVFLIAFGIIWVYPFVWMIFSSFKSNANFVTSGAQLIPDEFHWENYSRAWNEANISGYFLNSIIITLSVVAIVITLSCLTGYALGRVDFPGRRIIIASIGLIMFIPTGYTIIPLFELMSFLGLNNKLIGIIIAESSGAHVLFILLFAAFFSRIPKELEESAALDGSGFFRTFYKIMLPSARPVIATAFIMQFIWTWGSFLIPLVLSMSRPEIRNLAVGMLSFVGEYQTDWSGMAASATISLLPVVIVFIIMQKHFIEGIAGAVKS